MLSERLVDDLGNGQAVQVRLAPDGFDPAALDMEGDALSLLGGIAGLGEGGFPALPPGREFLEGRYQSDNPVIVHSGYTFGGQGVRSGGLDPFLTRGSRGSTSRTRVYTQCTLMYTEVYNRCTQVYKRLFALALRRS